ncbi:tetratricopeptide repeat protein [Roseicitreum antarcticum]|uniref:Flp pilus assembly protein TadD, contains TPR repeats n=1 Tax=Roseicitreum antarcticum TaxID=564137 RepID=A0A1H2XKS3_9RHOB|nr:tetratricopeptide repeat protein [Roseicitreum antarcticum]SDW93044.1 Flp pilus assembly protein TadD, contains TPR repeats [Roseicitreum antarcticum]
MRQWIVVPLFISGIFTVSACGDRIGAEASRQSDAIALVDQTNMTEIMMSAADPLEAISFFEAAIVQTPDRIELHRGLAKSLIRANRASAAVPVWNRVVAMPGSVHDDRVALAEALIRDNKWAEAEATLDQIPPTHETYERYRLEAMVADGNQEWAKADSFYEIASGLTTRPGSVYNNWGYSKLTRGDARDAERLFVQALQYDPNLFTAKNNMVLARAAQRQYQLPLVDMTQTERAQLLHTMAIAAIRQGDVNVGRGLLQEAIDAHPQHFEPAVRALRALEANVRTG